MKIKEWYAVFLSFVYFFCILASYYVLRPIRDQLAVEATSVKLPWFFAATFVATLALTPIFSWLVSRYSRRAILPFIYIFFIVCQIALVPLFNQNDVLKNFNLIFFVYVSVFNLFVVSVFWSFMADIWNDEEARNLFPIIAIGGALGAIFGPLITSVLVNFIPISSLLIISAILLFVAVICVFLLGKWADRFGSHRFEVNNQAPLQGSMLDGLKQIFNNPFVKTMAIMMILSDAIGTIAYVLVTDYSGIAFPNNAIAQTRFAAYIDLSANILQIILQLSLCRFLLVRFGAGAVFLICSLIIVSISLMLIFVKNQYTQMIWIMPPAAIIMIMTRSLTHGMILPARESLYTLVPRNVRYKGKNAVDTVVWRAGDILSIVSINGLRLLGMGMVGFELIFAGLSMTAGFIGWQLANRVEKGEFEDKK